MMENRQSVERAVPAAWENVLTQMREELAAEDTSAQMQKMRQMITSVEARTAACYRLKIDHARSKIAHRSAKRAKSLRWRYQFESADRVLEAAQTYLAMLSILNKSEVQADLTQEEFDRLVDQLTEECLFTIDNPDIWSA